MPLIMYWRQLNEYSRGSMRLSWPPQPKYSVTLLLLFSRHTINIEPITLYSSESLAKDCPANE